MIGGELTQAALNETSEIETASSHPQALLRWVLTYKFDLLLLLAAAASLIASCAIISPKKPFWNDELIAWVPINDPSLSHMLSALRNGVDGAPPLFHLTARAWALIFGGNEIGLRLFASAGFCVALIVLWCTLRRYYGTIATAFGLLTVWCTSDLFIFQASEARNYGLFCAAVAFTVAIFRALAESEDTLSLQLGMLTVASQAVLVMSHLYGIVYGGMTLIALVAWDRLNRRFRPAVYAIFATGWLALIPWLPTISRVSQLGKPYGWIPVPSLSALTTAYTFHVSLHVLFVFLAITAAGVLLSSGAPRPADRPTESQRLAAGGPLLALAITYLAVPLLAYLGSHLINPFFFERYMIPSSIGAAILLAAVAEAFLCKADLLDAIPPHWKRFATSFVFLGLIANPILVARDMPATQPGSVLEANFPPQLPVVMEHVYDFMTFTHYSRRPDRPYYFVVDLEAAADPRAPRDQLFLHKERQLWRDSGYLADRTLTTTEFVCGFDQFVVLHYPGLVWYEDRIQSDPAFESQPVGMLGDRMVLLVRIRPGLRPAVCR